jgi:hypothetical protein
MHIVLSRPLPEHVAHTREPIRRRHQRCAVELVFASDGVVPERGETWPHLVVRALRNGQIVIAPASARTPKTEAQGARSFWEP